jgi:hypothetical protein
VISKNCWFFIAFFHCDLLVHYIFSNVSIFSPYCHIPLIYIAFSFPFLYFFLPPPPSPSGEVSILVPGAGLGRLAYEIARRGYTSQGNEFSMHMLFGSHFILNCVSQPFSHTIHPWVTQFSNMMSYEDQTAPVAVPDVNPTALPQLGLFSMTAGDFLDIYRIPGIACYSRAMVRLYTYIYNISYNI